MKSKDSNKTSKTIHISQEKRFIKTSDGKCVQSTTTRIISINTRNNLSDREIFSKIISFTKD